MRDMYASNKKRYKWTTVLGKDDKAKRQCLGLGRGELTMVLNHLAGKC